MGDCLMSEATLLVLTADIIIWILFGVFLIITVIYPPFRERPHYWLISYTGIMGAAIGALVIILYDLHSTSSGSSVVAFINQVAIVGLIATLLALTYSPWQAYKNNQQNDDVITRLKRIERKLDESKPQNLFPEGNSGKKIIPSELQEDGDTKTVTTQFTSGNMTVISTIKITTRRE